MERQDYLKRQIEQIGLIIAGLLNLLKGRRPDDGMPMVTQACAEFFFAFEFHGGSLSNGRFTQGENACFGG